MARRSSRRSGRRSQMKPKTFPLFEGSVPLDKVYTNANKEGFIHRPNKESIMVLQGSDGKFKVFCIPCMRGRVPHSKSEWCGGKEKPFLCKLHREKPDETMAGDYEEFMQSLRGYEVPVVRGIRFPYLKLREHWKCMHSDDPQTIIQGGANLAQGIYYRRCDGKYKNIEGQVLEHVGCQESGDPECILQGAESITKSLYFKRCSGAYLNLSMDILTI